jgi:hypothetical protein
VIVLLIVDFLFDISQGTDHHACENSAKNLVETPLPCIKNLWNAQTRPEWEREYAVQTAVQSPNRPLTFGDLLQHDAEGVEGCPFGNPLDRWLANLDEFGTLVVASASLSEVSQRLTP